MTTSSGRPLNLHGSQPRQILLKRFEIRVSTILLHDRYDGALADKARQIIDVTVCIIALDPVAEPKDFRDAKIIAQPLLDLRAPESGVSIRIQKAGFGSEQRARAIDVYGTPFQDHARIKHWHVENLANPSGNDLVEITGRVFAAPRVVIPIDDCQARVFGARQKNRTVIPAPRFVCRNVMKGEPVEPQTGQHVERFGFVGTIADIDANRLGEQQRRDHSPQCRQHPIKSVRKTDSLAPGPRKPGRGMRLPFRGHPVTKRRWPFLEVRHLRRLSTRSPNVDGELAHVRSQFRPHPQPETTRQVGLAKSR